MKSVIQIFSQTSAQHLSTFKQHTSQSPYYKVVGFSFVWKETGVFSEYTVNPECLQA